MSHAFGFSERDPETSKSISKMELVQGLLLIMN